MVAVIQTGHSLHRILHYNENKVKEGVADLLLAENYPVLAKDLSLSQRLNRLLHQAQKNGRVKRHSFHASLNFDPSEKLKPETLTAIAREYMERIGFGDQPYLVYEHRDAGHPHIHIVSTLIRADGSRIDTFNIGRNQSETARKVIERRFGLVAAEKARFARQSYTVPPVRPEQVQYGKAQTKRAISLVLDHVLPGYKFTSLAELNAVLLGFRVLADRGREGSLMHDRGGLQYRALDEGGLPVGVPIKASDFYQQPTLTRLSSLFAAAEKERLPFRQPLRGKISTTLLQPDCRDLEDLIRLLAKREITLVPRRNAEGVVYGLTYVDHGSKSVFNGSDLGKSFSVKGVSDWFAKRKESIDIPRSEPVRPAKDFLLTKQTTIGQSPDAAVSGNDLISDLLRPEVDSTGVPYGLGPKRKRKKKRRQRRL